jgi:hypothetical protein
MSSKDSSDRIGCTSENGLRGKLSKHLKSPLFWSINIGFIVFYCLWTFIFVSLQESEFSNSLVNLFFHLIESFVLIFFLIECIMHTVVFK